MRVEFTDYLVKIDGKRRLMHTVHTDPAGLLAKIKAVLANKSKNTKPISFKDAMTKCWENHKAMKNQGRHMIGPAMDFLYSGDLVGYIGSLGYHIDLKNSDYQNVIIEPELRA